MAKKQKTDSKAKILLGLAKTLQGQFWDTLRELEEEIGCEVDANVDLENETLTSLKKKA